MSTPIDVLVTENIVGQPMDELRGKLSVALEPDLWKKPDLLAEKIATPRALVVRNQTRVTEDLIRAAGRLEIIARAGAGLDNVDVEAASRAGVVVASTPIQNAVSVAELTLGLMLSLARRIPEADRHVKAGGWARQNYYGTELFGKTLGVVGFGRIGFLTAMRARAFGMEVLAYDPYVDPDSLPMIEAQPILVELDELLRSSDFVTCHLPGGKQTQGLLGYDRFCRMKPAAYFINVARGEVVDEAGLLRALDERRLAGAALDVRSTEPPESDAFTRRDDVILLPHIGAFTHEAQHRVVASVCRDVQAVLGGGRAINYFNFPIPRKQVDGL
ncbi:MAG: hydroxyacid dehydrogenase [Pirellulales bacterium]|nr:hydroxyacid dehydrogenase [Pirellulales bacterium]